MVKFVNDVLVTGSVPTSKILYSAADEIAASDGEGEATEIATSIFATSSDLSSGLAAKADISSLASVATSGNYDDLGNLPALGTAASEDISFFATSDNAISRRTTATGINLNSLLGVTAGYTVPTIGSKKFHVTGLCFRNASVNLTLAAISAGWNGAYTNILAITALASLTAASLDKFIPMSGTIPAGSAGDVLNFQCTTAQGVAATVDADIIGYFA